MTRFRSAQRLAIGASALAALIALTGCGAQTAPEPSSTSTSTEGAGLETFTPGKLTFATGEPAYPPYVIDDEPSSGEGFEAAVAYAVAEELGYDKADVEWVRVGFEAGIAPGPKNYDINLQQVSISDERKNAVDFSSPYYTVGQAVVTVGSSAAAGAKSVADLKGLRIGVASGTTSIQVIEDVIQPETDALVFNTNDEVKVALENGQVDAIVTDLPTALYITAAELTDGVIIGQIEGITEGGEQWGLVLAKDSPLTAVVSKAVDTLRENGTLAELEKKWLADSAGAPVLK